MKRIFTIITTIFCAMLLAVLASAAPNAGRRKMTHTRVPRTESVSLHV